MPLARISKESAAVARERDKAPRRMFPIGLSPLPSSSSSSAALLGGEKINRGSLACAGNRVYIAAAAVPFFGRSSVMGRARMMAAGRLRGQGDVCAVGEW